MTEESQYPLVTFALFAYNQEKYIREAVEGALAQDYPNLEIILSDDCSPDGTFEIIQEIAKKYRGPHSIVLNRNAINLGIGAHINRLMEICRGELVVVAAGDDVSLPRRVQCLVDAWLAGGKRADSLCSAYESMDMEGVITGYAPGCVESNMDVLKMSEKPHGILGATGAWTRRSWQRFGPLPACVVYEDQIIPFRAALTGGGVLHVALPLVRYRQGVSVWIARGKSIDTQEMVCRTAVLKKNSIIAGVAQLQDALLMDRFDLAEKIVDRIARDQDEYAVYSGEASLWVLISRRLGALVLPLGLIGAFVKVKFPRLYKAILRHRSKV